MWQPHWVIFKTMLYFFPWDRVLLRSPGWPRTHDSPAHATHSAAIVLWSTKCNDIPWYSVHSLHSHSEAFLQYNHGSQHTCSILPVLSHRTWKRYMAFYSRLRCWKANYLHQCWKMVTWNWLFISSCESLVAMTTVATSMVWRLCLHSCYMPVVLSSTSTNVNTIVLCANDALELLWKQFWHGNHSKKCL
jgi:hypothetical protein